MNLSYKNTILCFLSLSITNLFSQTDSCLDSNRLCKLYSEDASNHFNFASLKPYLANQPIICLGEANHRVEQYGQLKVELIKYLHDSLGFNWVLFESGIANFVHDPNLSDTLQMVSNLYPIWHTEEILNLYAYQQQRKSTLKFSGLDVQSKHNLFPAYIKKKIMPIDTHLANEAHRFFTTLNAKSEERQQKVGGLVGRFVKHSVIDAALMTKLQDTLHLIKKQLGALDSYTPTERTLLNLTFQNYEKLLTMLVETNPDKQFKLREQYMSENIISYMNLFKNEKIVIWAHNGHINKKCNTFCSMIALLPDRLKKSIFSIALSSYEGRNGSLFGGSYAKKTPKNLKDYQILENIFREPVQRHRIIFYLFKPDETLCNQFVSLGDEKEQILFAQSYNALIFFDKISEAKNLFKK
jgi:erythromycin esterase